MPLKIRLATVSDATEMASLFHNTVKSVNSRDYLPSQIDAWAGEAPDPEKWRKRLGIRKTFVAELDGSVVGFAELGAKGYIDALYVHERHQRKGIASALMTRIEAEAELLGVEILSTDASITAQAFFAKRGFETIQARDVEYRGVTFRNYRMRKVSGNP
jgi:putative acetyltransferase